MALAHIFGLTLIPVAATVLGGAIAIFRVPSDKTRSLVQHFAAGVVMAVVAGELLPEMTREHRPLGVLIGFVLGVALMLGVKALTERIERNGEPGGGDGGSKTGLLGAAALMYLVIEQLLTEAHEVKETPLITASFFAGFVALYLLELMA